MAALAKTCEFCANSDIGKNGKCKNYKQTLDSNNKTICEEFEIAIAMKVPQNDLEKVYYDSDTFIDQMSEIFFVVLNNMLEQKSYKIILDINDPKIKLINYFTNDVVTESALKSVNFTNNNTIQIDISKINYMHLSHFLTKFIEECVVFLEIDNYLTDELYLAKKISTNVSLISNNTINIEIEKIKGDEHD